MDIFLVLNNWWEILELRRFLTWHVQIRAAAIAEVNFIVGRDFNPTVLPYLKHKLLYRPGKRIVSSQGTHLYFMIKTKTQSKDLRLYNISTDQI